MARGVDKSDKECMAEAEEVDTVERPHPQEANGDKRHSDATRRKHRTIEHEIMDDSGGEDDTRNP